jgi:hypothetical protein
LGESVAHAPPHTLLKRPFRRAQRRIGCAFKKVFPGEAGVEAVFDELIAAQKKKLLACAHAILPHVVEDDLLQPNDFPELENHPYFRYEEGVLEGLYTARMAYLAARKTL